jgi:GDP-L-fucose synthase
MADAWPSFSLRGKRVWIAGHRGMVGSALLRRLESEGCTLLTASRDKLDLCRQDHTDAFLAREKPEVIFLAAARVGGILANLQAPADFLYDNLAIATNVIDSAHRHGVEKLLYLGSTCVYPKFAPQPIREDSLLTGPLEPTNQWYALAKIVGIKLCDAYRQQHGCDFISAMPSNLYGPNDNFDLETSHVLPAFIARMDKARRNSDKEVVVWGTGTPKREFLHVDDCADALVFLMKHFSQKGPINVGTGTDLTVRELAELVAVTVGFDGELVFDGSKPDGTPRKVTDMTRLHALGWRAQISLPDGVRQTYDWYRENLGSVQNAPARPSAPPPQ